MGLVSYIGLDVDTKGFSIAVFSPESGEVREKRIRPSAKHLCDFLSTIEGKKKICYEAGYLGYSLQRALKRSGFECEVIAPSLIPEIKGSRVKTDRLDALKIAKYYARGLLTVVTVPDEEDEAVRGLLRSKQFAVKQLVQVKNRINGLCRAQGWDFKQEKQQKCYWTTLHESWLKDKLQLHPQSSFGINLELLLLQRTQLMELIAKYEHTIKVISETPRYKKANQALTSYRSISTMTSMSIITELGDIARFASPRQVASYVGFDITEYSSGGGQKRFGITRLGNAYLRYALVESTQFSLYQPKVSRALQKRREGVDPKFTEIADRSMARLHVKGTRLLFKGKHKNQVKVAMARELVGFIWESLREARGEKPQKFIKGTVQIRKPTDSPR
jgi:transposase